MPRWDLKCKQCGRRDYETFVSVAERDDWLKRVVCACEGRFEVLPAAPSFVLKGAGWTPKSYDKGGK
jgi:predicted nucleic acid-binding Zn ribbon protein